MHSPFLAMHGCGVGVGNVELAPPELGITGHALLRLFCLLDCTLTGHLVTIHDSVKRTKSCALQSLSVWPNYRLKCTLFFPALAYVGLGDYVIFAGG